MINEINAKAYCSEDISKIENYEQAVNDKTQMWDCHHRLEIQGQFRNSTALLKKCGLYYHVPASQLIFLTKSEHRRLHGIVKPFCGEKHPMFGKHHSEETRKKMSMSLRGKHHSEETRKKMSMSLRGKHHSEETRKKMSEKAKLRAPISDETRKKLSMSLRGKSPWNKGKHLSHLSMETKKRMSAGKIGMKFWNNGVKCVRSKECPGQGWVRGRKPH